MRNRHDSIGRRGVGLAIGGPAILAVVAIGAPVGTVGAAGRPSPIEHAGGPDAVVLELRQTPGGARVPGRADLVLFQLRGDGHVEYRPWNEGRVGWNVPPLRSRLNESGVQEVLAYALGPGDLPSAKRMYPFTTRGPAGSTVFGIHVAGLRKRVEYQLPLGNLLLDDDTATAGLRALGRRLANYVPPAGALGTPVGTTGCSVPPGAPDAAAEGAGSADALDEAVPGPVGVPWLATLESDVYGTCWLPDVAAWSGGFVAIGPADGATPAAAIWRSDDGTDWAVAASASGPIVPAGGRLERVVAYRDGLLALGTDGRRLVTWRSDDGVAWERIADGPELGDGDVPADLPYHLTIDGVAVRGERVLVAGSYRLDLNETHLRVWASEDGAAWTRAIPDGLAAGPLWSVTADAERFLGLALLPPLRDLAYSVVESVDGATWRTAGELPPGIDRLLFRSTDGAYLGVGTTVDTSGGGFAIDDAEVAVVRSADLATWSGVDVPSGTSWYPSAVAERDGTVVITGGADGPSGSYPWMISSVDGGPWVASALWPGMTSGSPVSAAIGNDAIVVTGSSVSGIAAWVHPIER